MEKANITKSLIVSLTCEEGDMYAVKVKLNGIPVKRAISYYKKKTGGDMYSP